jgi:hypothetical protein
MELTFARAEAEGETWAEYYFRLQRCQQKDKRLHFLSEKERYFLEARLAEATFSAAMEIGGVQLLSPKHVHALKARAKAKDAQALLDCQAKIKALLTACLDRKAVRKWLTEGMPDRRELDETEAARACKAEISELVNGLASPRDRDAILLWPRLGNLD